MKELLFTSAGRINRAKFLLAALCQFIVAAVATLLLVILWSLIPGEIKADGTYDVSGPMAVPYIAISVAYVVFSAWSGISVGIERYHDRGKSGWRLLIMLIPLIGGLWYFIETIFLRGTAGANQYGADPLPAVAR